MQRITTYLLKKKVGTLLGTGTMKKTQNSKGPGGSYQKRVGARSRKRRGKKGRSN